MIEKNITPNENLVQDNSSTECVSPETNPMDTVQSNELIFGHTHNGVKCAVCPTAKRACDRAWFSAKQIENWSEMTKGTLRNRLIELEECERISRGQDFNHVDIPTETGAVKTTLYNLNVLNQLAMVEMKNKVLNDTAKKFSDILSEVETTGSYGVAHQEMSDEEIMSRALEIAHRTLALREERIKALTAERDEAVRTKTQYQSNLAAQMSGRVGGLTTALNRVKLENNRLKGDRLTKEDVYIIMNTQGVSFTLKTVKDVIRDELNIISEYLKEPFPKITTGERTDPNGKTFEIKSFVYTRKTVQAFFEFVENNPIGSHAVIHRKSGCSTLICYSLKWT